MEPSSPASPSEALKEENRRLKERIAALERENENLRSAAASPPLLGLTQLKEIADLIPAIIWANDETGACVFANKECTAFTGRASSEEAGEAWSHSIHPEDREAVYREFQVCLHERRRFTRTYRMYSRPAGGYRWILDTGAPVYLSDGRYAGLLGTCVDVTPQKELEQTLREARLESETKRKLEFLSVMSHELRTPLTSIIGLSEILNAEPSQEVARSHLGAIKTAAVHLKQLVSNFLDAEKFGVCGQLTLVNGHCNLLTCLREVVAMMEPAANTKSLFLRLESDIELAHCDAWADETRWKQVAINLISNGTDNFPPKSNLAAAIKFTDTGGVVVSLARAPDNSFTLTVTDTGVGIPPEHREKVTQPFCQLLPRDGHSQEGTGLGLYVTRKIIDAWGGRFSISDNPPRGTAIRVGFVPLPMPDAQAEATPAAALPRVRSGSTAQTRVLIVEDNRTIQHILQHFLRQMGIPSPDSAFDGAEGLTKASQGQYDIIFMDCQMPVLDGFAAVSRIRGMKLSMQPVIIALTALALPGDRERCLAAGMDDYLQKPFTQSHVQRCLDSARQLVKQRQVTC